MLASALRGHGFDAAMLDLSLAFYSRHFDTTPQPGPVNAALDYLKNAKEGYDPERHRNCAGILHNDLKRFETICANWKLTAMDIAPPVPVHHPSALAQQLIRSDPFADLWARSLQPVLEQRRPGRVVISLAYLSQLAATLSLVRFLEHAGIQPIVGGSLPRSLHATGSGLQALARVLPHLDLSNGSTLIAAAEQPDFLHRLHWPELLCDRDYLSAQPVVPLALSTGCYWKKCRFCPDRSMPFHAVPDTAVDEFLRSIPEPIRNAVPMIHLLDSAIPPSSLRAFCPIARQHGVRFYGFARPENAFLNDRMLRDAADSGCRMLQFGVESGSGELLNRFDKGIDPARSQKILAAAAMEGIRTYVYMLFGLPGETATDRAATLALLRDNTPFVDFLNLSIFNLPVTSDIDEQAAAMHMDISGYTADEDAICLYRPFRVNGTDHRRTARDFIHNELLMEPAIRRIHRQTPRWFRAAHLSMMNLPGRR